MLKFTEKEVRDHIRRYGIEHAGDTLKGVAKEMAAEQFAIMTQQKIPAFEMPNGDVLYVSYNKESDMIDIGPVTNAGLVAQHRFPYDHNASLDANLQTVNENLNSYKKQSTAAECADKTEKDAELFAPYLFLNLFYYSNKLSIIDCKFVISQY